MWWIFSNPPALFSGSIYCLQFYLMEWKGRFFVHPQSESVEVVVNQSDVELSWSDSAGQIHYAPLANLQLSSLEGSQKLTIRPLAQETWSLLIEDPLVGKQICKVWPGNKGKISGQRSWIGVFLVGLTGLLVLFIALAFLFWKLNPFLADRLANRIPHQWEWETGDQMLKTILVESKVDTHNTKLLQNFYRKCYPLEISGSERLRPISITVVSNEEFNAFAIPGRHIVVYSGVFSQVQNYQELMALIGHEAGHVENRHSIRSVVRAGTLYLAFSLVLGDLTGLSALFLDQAQNLQNLSYSRDFEREADLESHRFLCQNNTDPKATVSLMKILDVISSSRQGNLPAFLQSHPMTKERLENAQKELSQHPCKEQIVQNKELEQLFTQMKLASKIHDSSI